MSYLSQGHLHESEMQTASFKIWTGIADSSEYRGNLRGLMVKVPDCRLKVSELELQFRYYFHFWINTLGKGMNPLIPQAMVWIIPLLFFEKDGFGQIVYIPRAPDFNKSSITLTINVTSINIQLVKI